MKIHFAIKLFIYVIKFINIDKLVLQNYMFAININFTFGNNLISR